MSFIWLLFKYKVVKLVKLTKLFGSNALIWLKLKSNVTILVTS